jgi:hypothetical protein
MKKFVKANRKQCSMKLSLQGPSGSGKTIGALRLAKGLAGSLDHVAVIDTENGSSHLYSHMGEFSVFSMEAPYTPEMFIQAIETAVQEGFKCIIIDSLSHEWFGTGGILDIHSNKLGNSFANWSKVTPRHNALINNIVKAPVHIIATFRSKTDYVIQQVNGKSVPEKIGLKAVAREDSEYEFTVAFELNRNYVANVTKDRTGMFVNQPELRINESIGAQIASWCDLGKNEPKSELTAIQECKSVDELESLLEDKPDVRDALRNEVSTKMDDLLMVQQYKFQQNGHYHGK